MLSVFFYTTLIHQYFVKIRAAASIGKSSRFKYRRTSYTVLTVVNQNIIHGNLMSGEKYQLYRMYGWKTGSSDDLQTEKNLGSKP